MVSRIEARPMSVMTPLPRMPVKLAASLVGRGGRLSAGCAAAAVAPVAGTAGAVGAGGAVSGASVPGTTPGCRPYYARKAGMQRIGRASCRERV